MNGQGIPILAPADGAGNDGAVCGGRAAGGIDRWRRRTDVDHAQQDRAQQNRNQRYFRRQLARLPRNFLNLCFVLILVSEAENRLRVLNWPSGHKKSMSLGHPAALKSAKIAFLEAKNQHFRPEFSKKRGAEGQKFQKSPKNGLAACWLASPPFGIEAGGRPSPSPSLGGGA